MTQNAEFLFNFLMFFFEILVDWKLKKKEGFLSFFVKSLIFTIFFPREGIKNVIQYYKNIITKKQNH